uniref:DDE_Tnp_1_7 domain-containing protein n=1 Tax=Steinernema glaseri TaxID=37863 RepID=A0A1I8A502_9BILA
MSHNVKNDSDAEGKDVLMIFQLDRRTAHSKEYSLDWEQRCKKSVLGPLVKRGFSTWVLIATCLLACK